MGGKYNTKENDGAIKYMNEIPGTSYSPPIKVTPLRRLIIFVLIPILKAVASLNIETPENLPLQGSAILACNHLSFFDGFALQYAVKRPVYFMSKEEVFKNPFLRFFMYQIGAFPVARDIFDRSAVLQAGKVLKAGQVLGMFPEGKRTYGHGMIAAKTGTAHLAMKMNCPINPVAMNGTENIFKKPFKRAQVKIKICPPIYPDDKMSAPELTNKVMMEIARNLPPSLRGVYS